jgi:hydroxymethylpyrimidine/phosphomethylpyrimidine kinase
MLVFRRGEWMQVTLPFSDPGLTEGQRRFAAAVAASEMARGATEAAAVRAAEQRMYEWIYPELRISREEHGTPQH